MLRYLVFFTTPVIGGWKPQTHEAVAIVADERGELPYGWEPQAINGVDVQEIRYIIPLGEGCIPQIIAGEYDRDVPITHDGEVFVMNDATMTDEDETFLIPLN